MVRLGCSAVPPAGTTGAGDAGATGAWDGGLAGTTGATLTTGGADEGLAEGWLTLGSAAVEGTLMVAIALVDGVAADDCDAPPPPQAASRMRKRTRPSALDCIRHQ